MNSSPASGRIEVFDTIGEASLAWFFVMANWSLPSDKPSFQVRAGSKVIFCATPGNLAEIDRLIGRAMLTEGPVADSARALKGEFRSRGLYHRSESSSDGKAAG